MVRLHFFTRALVAVLLVFVPVCSSAQTLGSEFLVNTYVLDNQHAPSVAAVPGQGFVVVWQSERQDGSGSGIYGQRYTAAGVRVGAEFRVNSSTSGSQYGAAVTPVADGGFVVAWAHDETGGLSGIRAQRFDATGSPVGPEITISSAWTAVLPSVAAGPNDGFVVAWLDRTTDATGDQQVRGRRFDASNNPLGDDFQISATALPFDEMMDPPVVASDSSGNFVVVWHRNSYSICFRRYDTSGTPLGDEVTVDTSGSTSATLRHLTNPSVAVAPSGEFVVVWESRYLSGGSSTPPEVFARRYSAAGAAVGAGFRVNATAISTALPMGSRPAPAVAFDATGKFIVAWQNDRIYGRWYSAGGAAIGDDFAVNPNLTGGSEPAVTAIGNSTFVAAWTDPWRDGNGSAVYGQRLRMGPDLVMSAFNAPAAAIPGATLLISSTVLNQGGEFARGTITEIRLSTTLVISDGDPVVADWVTVNLNPGQADPLAMTVTLPFVPPGQYYLIAVADLLNMVPEASETNNTFARSISIGPDLMVAALTAPASAMRGTDITIFDTTRNGGAMVAGPSTTRFYLSADRVVNRMDMSLGARAIGALSAVPSASATCEARPASCSAGATSVSIPFFIAPGTYYLFAVSDSNDAVQEANEMNNARSVMIRIF